METTELLFLAVGTGVAALAAARSLDAPMFSLRKEDWTPEPTTIAFALID